MIGRRQRRRDQSAEAAACEYDPGRFHVAAAFEVVQGQHAGGDGVEHGLAHGRKGREELGPAQAAPFAPVGVVQGHDCPVAGVAEVVDGPLACTNTAQDDERATTCGSGVGHSEVSFDLEAPIVAQDHVDDIPRGPGLENRLLHRDQLTLALEEVRQVILPRVHLTHDV